MTTLSTLAGIVAARSVEVARLTAAKSLPEPDLADQDAFNRYSTEDLELRNARNELASAAQDLARLAQSPEDHVLQLGWSVCHDFPTMADFSICFCVIQLDMLPLEYGKV